MHNTFEMNRGAAGPDRVGLSFSQFIAECAQ
jgi:hypothetical protein